MAINDQELKKVVEAVAILMGWRGNGDKAALLRGELANLQEFIAKLTKGAKTLENQLNVINGDVVQAKQDISEQKDQLEQLQQGLATVQQGLASAENALEELNSNLATAQEKIDNIAEGSSTATQDLAKLKQQTGTVAPPSPTQGQVSAPPDATQFNQALVDIAAAMTAISQLKNAITT